MFWFTGPGTEKPTTSTSGFKDIMAEDDEKVQKFIISYIDNFLFNNYQALTKCMCLAGYSSKLGEVEA